MQPIESTELTKGPVKRNTPAFVPLILAGLFMVTGICVLLVIGREKARIIGQTITEMDIQPLLNADGPITDEDMKGKVVVLYFWGYWCPDCVKELADFVKAQRSYLNDPKVLFASIACSNRSDESQDSLKFYTNKFLQSVEGNDLPTYTDPAEFSRTRVSQLMTKGGFAYPTTLVIDGEGRVVDVWRSAVPPNALSKAIEKAKQSDKTQP
jgi:thiol-disulfide isomerase/thioredoxin